MTPIVVLGDYCKSCGLCIAVCPKKVLAIGDKPNAKGYYHVVAADADKCIGCGLCGTMCPDLAIEIHREK